MQCNAMLLSRFSHVRLCATTYTAAPSGTVVKNHLPMQEPQEMWVQLLSREDSLEKAMPPHSSTLAWKIPWMKEPGGLQSMGSLRVGHN